MSLDIILTNVRISGADGMPTDIGIKGGVIAAVQTGLRGDCPIEDMGGRLAVPGFIEMHIHLDKSGLMDVCNCQQGSLAEAVAAVAHAKRGFTQDDVYARARRTLEKSICHGVTRMRTHVEVDPRVGLTSLRALQSLKRDYAWAIDLQLCAFPQEGLIDDPGCEDVLIEALESGADLVGGAPYMDRDSVGHIGKIFDMARRFDMDIDLHLDFSLDISHLDIEEVCRRTDAQGWGGRVAVGHVTKLSALPALRLAAIARLMADAGVALTVLPSTDLFLMGRDHDHDVPRGVAPAHRLLEQGVTCTLSTNNVLNPFTPFGDCSLVRIANLFANIVQIGTPEDMRRCLDMITVQPAKLMRASPYGLFVGGPADLAVLDCAGDAQVVAELAPVLMGFKRGRKVFSHPPAMMFPPDHTNPS